MQNSSGEGNILLNSEEISQQINSDDEALAVLASLGFTMSHWPFIKKVEGAKGILSSKLVTNMLLDMQAKCTTFAKAMSTIRAGLDAFYDTGGFLVSPNTHPLSRLFKVSSAPLVFFGRYNHELLNKSPGVAIVGSRQADGDALKYTKNLALTLAKYDINIVSGGAQGIDTAAHLGAHEALGFTTLISGVRCSFTNPQVPPDLACIPLDKLLILYPYGPFFPQKNYMFVTRNQFVAALSDYLVVVQGVADSGTLHTAKYAQELKIPIFAIPGALNNPKSFVPNHLLEQGAAKALVSFEQFAASLVPKRLHVPKNKAKPAKAVEDGLPYLLGLIRKHDNALTMGELMALSGKSFSECQSELLDYELAGRIFKRGAQFVLRDQ